MRDNPYPVDTSPMTILTPTTPESLRGKEWKKYARNASWSIADGTFTYTAPSSSALQDWFAPIGDAPGQIAKCVHVSGRFGTGHGNIVLLDHYVFVDCDGQQVGRAIRRSVEGLTPTAAFWSLAETREFLKDNDLTLTSRVFGHAGELNDAYPDLLTHCPTLAPKRKILGIIPI